MIRRAEVRDASRLAEILIFAKRCAYRIIFQNDVVSFNELSVLELGLHFRDDPEALEGMYVYDDGIVRGLMHIGQQETGGRKVFWLKELYVDYFFQKQGIGKRLMEDFLRKARSDGAGSAFLWVLEKNTPARRFYEAAGFRATGEREREPETPEYLLKYEMVFWPVDLQPLAQI